MKVTLLILSIATIPALLGMTFRAPIHAQSTVQVETADERQFESCTTDLDCECKQGYGEELNMSEACVVYRSQVIAVAGAK